MPRRTDDIESHSEDEDAGYLPLGFSWVLAGNPFLRVELTDLGLIEASGLWTELAMPQQAAQITARFQELLDALDEPRVEAAT